MTREISLTNERISARVHHHLLQVHVVRVGPLHSLLVAQQVRTCGVAVVGAEWFHLFNLFGVARAVGVLQFDLVVVDPQVGFVRGYSLLRRTLLSGFVRPDTNTLQFHTCTVNTGVLM